MPRDPFFPKTAAVLAAEKELGLDVQTNPAKLADIISLEDLRREESLTSLITENILNALRREHGINLRVEEPETEGTATPRLRADERPPAKPSRPPTFQELGNLVVGSGI